MRANRSFRKGSTTGAARFSLYVTLQQTIQSTKSYKGWRLLALIALISIAGGLGVEFIIFLADVYFKDSFPDLIMIPIAFIFISFFISLPVLVFGKRNFYYASSFMAILAIIFICIVEYGIITKG